MLNFIKTTSIGGVIFLIPVIIAVAVLGKAFNLVLLIAVPLAESIGIESIGGIAIVNVLAVAIILAICFLAGLFAKSVWGIKTFQALDTQLQMYVPGYAFLKSQTAELDISSDEHGMQPVMIRLDDQSQVAFEVERTQDGQVVVFIPGAPDPRSGAVALLEPERVTSIDSSFITVSRVFKRLGQDTRMLIDER
ncbi:MAG: hypothetical protein AB4050_18080 [Synechococcus sp.]